MKCSNDLVDIEAVFYQEGKSVTSRKQFGSAAFNVFMCKTFKNPSVICKVYTTHVNPCNMEIFFLEKGDSNYRFK